MNTAPTLTLDRCAFWYDCNVLGKKTVYYCLEGGGIRTDFKSLDDVIFRFKTSYGIHSTRGGYVRGDCYFVEHTLFSAFLMFTMKSTEENYHSAISNRGAQHIKKGQLYKEFECASKSSV